MEILGGVHYRGHGRGRHRRGGAGYRDVGRPPVRGRRDAGGAGRADGDEHRRHPPGPGRDGQDDQLTAALDILTGQFGPPAALVYNAGLIRHDRPGELSREQYVTAYAINVLGAMTAAVHVAPAMAAAGGGSILITGGMPEPDPALTSLSLGKAAVRALTTLLAGEYGPAGIHVATVTVGGAVAPGGRFDPDRIAEEYWRLHTQRPEAWEHKVAFTGAGTEPRSL
jgi:NAD(P)-dependent dehydrogenase (short-subunit alcohol dehydrogenase family)